MSTAGGPGPCLSRSPSSSTSASSDPSRMRHKAVLEGPVLLSTNRVISEDMRKLLEIFLSNAVKENTLSNDPSTTVMLLSGIHGGEDGKSGLSEKSMIRHWKDKYPGSIANQSYVNDCDAIGVKARKRPEDLFKQLPLLVENIPDIMEPMGKILNGQTNRLTKQPDMCNMTFKVVDSALYHGHKAKLVEDIKKFKPKVIILGWCYSLNSDFSLELRQLGVSSVLLLNHDLKILTGDPDAELDPWQVELIEDFVIKIPRHVFLSGSPGTGKTLSAVEMAKIMQSQPDWGDKPVIVTNFLWSDGLEENYTKKYFSNIDNVEIVHLRDLKEQLNVDIEEVDYPVQTVNALISGLTSKYPGGCLLLCDEVFPCTKHEEPDWSGLTVNNTVNWIIIVRPTTDYYDKPVVITPPSGPSVLARQLLTKHRNCRQIEEFNRYMTELDPAGVLPSSSDLPAARLPPGHAPVWLQFHTELTTLEMLVVAKEKIEPLSRYRVTVVYSLPRGRDEAVAAWCAEQDWRYVDAGDMVGCEDQAVISIDDVDSELTTRAHSLLVLITSPVRSEDDERMVKYKNGAVTTLQHTLNTDSSLITHITVGEQQQSC